MNTIYRDLVLARIRGVVEQAKAISEVRHRGLKGNLREILIRDLFRPLLPAGMEVGTGQIISVDGRKSRQQDVVIFDKRILPSILFEEFTGIFPVESVLYAIEIKSRLTSKDLRGAHKNAYDLRTFNYSAFGDSAGYKLISALFAFQSDLKKGGKNEIARYQSVCKGDGPALKAICVVDRGYWYWSDDEVHEYQCSYLLEEVVAFLAGVTNTLPQISRSGTPLLGRYLITE